MSAPTNPIRDLTGKKVLCWLVVAYAGQRGGVHCWRSMYRASLAEKVVAESEIQDPNANALSSIYPRWFDALKNPTGWIYGERLRRSSGRSGRAGAPP